MIAVEKPQMLPRSWWRELRRASDFEIRRGGFDDETVLDPGENQTFGFVDPRADPFILQVAQDLGCAGARIGGQIETRLRKGQGDENGPQRAQRVLVAHHDTAAVGSHRSILIVAVRMHDHPRCRSHLLEQVPRRILGARGHVDREIARQLRRRIEDADLAVVAEMTQHAPGPELEGQPAAFCFAPRIERPSQLVILLHFLQQLLQHESAQLVTASDQRLRLLLDARLRGSDVFSMNRVACQDGGQPHEHEAREAEGREPLIAEQGAHAHSENEDGCTDRRGHQGRPGG
jgi:hypothetical protein